MVYDVFENKTMLDSLSFVALDLIVKVTDDILFRYVLSFSQNWRVLAYYVMDGFPRLMCHDKVGVASDEWMEDYFGDGDLNLEMYA